MEKFETALRDAIKKLLEESGIPLELVGIESTRKGLEIYLGWTEEAQKEGGLG